MNKGLKLLVVFSLAVAVLVSFVSAGFFDEIWGRMTGQMINTVSCRDNLNSNGLSKAITSADYKKFIAASKQILD